MARKIILRIFIIHHNIITEADEVIFKSFNVVNIHLNDWINLLNFFYPSKSYIHKAKLHFKIVMIYNIIMIHTAVIHDGRMVIRKTSTRFSRF